MRSAISNVSTFLFVAGILLVPFSVAEAVGDGYILKRSPEKSCHSCHRTDQNTPAPGEPGYVQAIWDSAIKMHGSDILGSCSNTAYQTRKACENNLETWTPGKWGPGGWGTAGGQYGVFLCTTCHAPHETRNIYLIRESIRTPSGENFNWGATNSASVDFRVKTGTAGTTVGIMGDDTTPRTSSSNVCEVCHSLNKYHNYDSSRNTDGDHNNAIDCSPCHSHKKSFKPGCNACHGAPPTAGGQKHATHFGTGTTSSYTSTAVQSTTAEYRFSCGICHQGIHMNSSAPNPRTVEVVFTGLATQGSATGAAYTPSTNSVDSPSGSSYSFNYSGGTCSDTYCHGNYPGSGKNASPAFLGTASCGSCHEATNTSAPATASHLKHTLSVNYNFPCTLCHKGIAGGSGPAGYTIADKSRHVSGFVDWKFDTTDARLTSSLSPSAAYNIATGTVTPSDGTIRAFGACANLYCHSNASPASNNDPLRNVPNEFKAVTWDGRAMACYSCHKGQVADNTEANCTGTGGMWDTYCATTQGLCEGNGGTWDASRRVCTNVVESVCTTTLSGRWIAVCAPTLTMSTNAHLRLVGPQWIRKYPCTYCHGATIDASGIITDKTKHVNAVKDVVISSLWNVDWTIPGQPEPSYDPVTKVCSSLYCHSDGTADPEQIRAAPWNGPKTECNSCHGHPQGGCSTANCHDGIKVSQICVGITQDVCESNSGLWNGAPSPGMCRGITDARCTTLGGSARWPAGKDWMASMPMFPNQGPGTRRANSHARHVETNFTCDACHYSTVKNGVCTDCHTTGIPSGDMGEVAHVDAVYHVNKNKDVVFQDLSWRYFVNTGNPNTDKTCQNSCHIGGNPQWGGSLSDGTTICLSCHGTTGDDVDYYGTFTNDPAIRPLINLTEWYTNGHGRPISLGNYPSSGNPPANFPGNPCWYCHDNNVLHTDATNPFRLKKHDQFKKRFEKECVYCHMQGLDRECLECHNTAGSLAVQLSAIGYLPSSTWPDGSPAGPRPDHNAYTDGLTSCITSDCHYVDPANPTSDLKRHNSGAGLWTADQEKDVKNQYIWMGVCLKCHDDDGVNGSNCSGCHTDYNQPGSIHKLGYDPGTGFIMAQRAKASSVHFGYKHYNYFLNTGGWTKDENGKYTGTMKGGKFCWDCHDPHGDKDASGNYNIHMIHRKVATSTDGVFGKPLAQGEVSFTRKQNGLDYAKSSPPYNGICNVCHHTLYDGGNNVLVEAKHYTNDYGDHHNEGRVCTTCHEHRFTDSHSSGSSCNTCHMNKPIPRHSGFGLPRDCTLCHKGTVGSRMDIMGQMTGNAHHVQGVTLSNKHCYVCHWEATSIGLIDVNYHLGYNYKTHTSVKNAPSDLVIWGAGGRPTTYIEGVTAETFDATKVGTANERAEVAKVTTTCLGCHSDQNNDTKPFAYCSVPAYVSSEGHAVYITTETACTTAGGTWLTDCKTPRQYAWDLTSIAARYSRTDSTTWGKYTGQAGAAKRNFTKALSAHGNATANEGGWDTTGGAGLDGDLTGKNTRGGSQNVQCFDCHSSHGSKLTGNTSSYTTTYGPNGAGPYGGNLKETSAGKGGYSMTYKASSNASGVNPYGAGAGQCFDCHETANTGACSNPSYLYRADCESNGGTWTPSGKPWGYNSTYGATSPIIGYKDTLRFGQGVKASQARYTHRANKNTIVGGHLKASSALIVPARSGINGLCTPCHDPHGVSPILGTDQAYAVPLLKGTWLTSPYKEDAAQTGPTSGPILFDTNPYPYVYTDSRTFGGSTRLSENDEQFAGLCLNCHPKSNLTDGINKNTSWKGLDRIHESVKGWGANTMHSYPCSKCHQPHNSGLPRLMQTDCLDYNHRGRVPSGGQVSDARGAYLHERPFGNLWEYSSGSFPKGYAGPDQYDLNYKSNCHPTGTWPDNRWNDKTLW